MILECSQCRTRYLVPDSAVGPDGRTVRCAACKHSWFQPGDTLDLVARAEAAPDGMAPSPSQPQTQSASSQAFRHPDGEEEAPGFDPFAHEPPFRARRNPAKLWTMAAIGAGLVMTIGAGALLWSGGTGIGKDLGLAVGDTDTPLQIVSNPIERRDLDNGSEMFAISGKVVNPTNARQHVPDIRVELKDAQNRVVYNWTVRPEAMSLGPHGSVDFNSAKLDVPVNSRQLALSFSGGGG